MYIREAEIKSFGGIREKTFRFFPGLNVICGENESGKSTLQNFLSGMLFGMEKPRGRGSLDAPYNRYEPWQAPSYYAGSLRFSTGGQDFYLERNFYHKEKNSYLVNERDGEKLSVEQGDLQMLLGGMNKRAYENTFLLRQGACRPQGDLHTALQDEMNHLAETGDGSFQLSNVLERLNRQKRELEKQLKSIRQEQEAKKERLNTECEMLKEQQEKLREKIQEQSRLLKREQAKEDAPVPPLQDEKPKEVKKADPLQTLPPMLTFGVAASVLWLVLRSRMPEALGWPLQLVFLTMILIGWWQNSRQKRRRQAEEERKMRARQSQKREQEEAQRLKQQRQMQTDRQQVVWQTLQEELREKEILLENRTQALEEFSQSAPDMRKLEKQVQAVDLAIETLQKLTSGQSSGVSERLVREMNRIFAEVSGDAERKMHLEKQGRPALEAERKIRRAEDFSGGTSDQLYFAYRMAAGELLEGDETLPFLLDEAFAMYDNQRLKQTLHWLAAQQRQIFIFTCQEREAALLEELQIPFSEIRLRKDTVKI